MWFSLDWLVEQIKKYQESAIADVSLEYIREADEDDEQRSQLFVDELPT
jgi:hypothetical protein